MKRRWMVLPWLAAPALALLLAGRHHLEAVPALRNEAAGTPEASCKMAVPLRVDIAPSATGQGDRWLVSMQSMDEDHDVVLRLGSGAEASQVVRWQGHLLAGQEQTLDLQFTPDGLESSVWAVLEIPDQEGATLRAYAQAARPGATPARVASEANQVVRDPNTGEEVIQFTGQVRSGR